MTEKKESTRKISGLLFGQKGAALVLVTLSLTVLLSSAALVTDVGLIYFYRSKVANAADAAALAGIQALPGDEAKARAVALEYAAKNGVSNIQVTVSEDKKSLTVRAERDFNFYFARFLGYEESQAVAQAGARLEPISGVRGIVPLGIKKQTLIYGEEYLLKDGAGEQPEGEYHSGWMGILALQGPGARLYLDDLEHGFNDLIEVDDILNIQTGNISGKTYTGVQYRIDQCKHTPSCTAESYNPDCTKIVMVPIISDYGTSQVKIEGFAAFFLESVAGMGTESEIRGKFLYYTTAGPSTPGGTDYGLYAPRLTT